MAQGPPPQHCLMISLINRPCPENYTGDRAHLRIYIYTYICKYIYIHLYTVSMSRKSSSSNISHIGYVAEENITRQLEDTTTNAHPFLELADRGEITNANWCPTHLRNLMHMRYETTHHTRERMSQSNTPYVDTKRAGTKYYVGREKFESPTTICC